MKKRIKIDGVILAFCIILTGVLCKFPGLYCFTPGADQLLSFLGFLAILKGVFIRMVARGHKKIHSGNGQGLVTSGPYQYVRNPMYLGSFLLGCGFILLLWPWWALPIYAGLFYYRFRQQIIKEEEYLQKNFGEEFKIYCQKVPRLFPRLQLVKPEDIKRDFPLEQGWLTKEKNGLFVWPMVAFALKLLQQKLVFGYVYWPVTWLVFLMAVILFGVSCWLIYPDARRPRV